MRLRTCISVILLFFCFDAVAETEAKPAGREPTLKIGGLIQFQADFGERGDSRFTTADDRFYLRRARLNANGNFLEEFDFKVELELSGSLSNNSTSVSTSNLRAQLTDGYVNWNRHAGANIKGGQFKSPFGYEQLVTDARLFTIERSLVNDRLTIGRQIGAQVWGSFYGKRLSYAYGLFNGNSVNVSFNDNDSFLPCARLAGIPWQGKLFGKESNWTAGGNMFFSEDTNLTGQSADFSFGGNAFTGKRQGSGIDSQLHIGPMDLWVEYLLVRFEPEDNIPLDRFTPSGWYAQFSYYFTKRIQGVGKYERFDPDLEPNFTATSTWTFGLNYEIKGHDLKMQLNYLRTEATGILEIQDKILCRFQLVF